MLKDTDDQYTDVTNPTFTTSPVSFSESAKHPGAYLRRTVRVFDHAGAIPVL